MVSMVKVGKLAVSVVGVGSLLVDEEVLPMMEQACDSDCEN